MSEPLGPVIASLAPMCATYLDLLGDYCPERATKVLIGLTRHGQVQEMHCKRHAEIHVQHGTHRYAVPALPSNLGEVTP